MPALDPQILTVVLVAPRYADNVGAVARAMANFGGKALRLVAPNAMTRDGLARRAARAGEELLDAAQTFDTLAEALDGIDLTIATSHRAGRHRRPLTPWALSGDLLDRVQPRSVALVFGPEDHGLKRDEIDLCRHLVRIPTRTPMNLAQSAVVLLYELCARERGAADHRPAAADGAVPRIVAAASDALTRAGYPRHRKPMEGEMAKLADILSRARPDPFETNFLMGIFRHLARADD